MNRLTIALSAITVLLCGIVIAQFVALNQAKPLSEADVRAIVSSMIVDADAGQSLSTGSDVTVSALDPATLNPMIENYLLSEPRILQRVSEALQAELMAEEQNNNRIALAALQTQLYDDPDHVVVGNPDGDVTLIEFFDYNCSYCRTSLPDMVALIESDPNLRIILKEFPILSEGSLEAAKVAVAISKMPETNYWDFHTALFSGRGQANLDSALAAAQTLGLTPDMLTPVAESDATMGLLQRNYAIAEALNITGTPTFIIGDEVLPGAVGVDILRERIANMRACGSASCIDS